MDGHFRQDVPPLQSPQIRLPRLREFTVISGPVNKTCQKILFRYDPDLGLDADGSLPKVDDAKERLGYWLKGAFFFHSQCGKILAKLFLFPQFIL